MLELSNLSVSYGQVQVLHGVSLRVEAGEIVSLVGANASGKTTLLRSVSGLLPVDSGRITFGGADITRMRSDRIVRLGLCQVPEGRHIFPAFSVYRNLEMGAYLRTGRVQRKDFSDDLDRVFQLFPVLKERRKQKAGTLSGGEQQMVAIGRALMSRPRLLALDEPSIGLAPLVVDQIFETVKRLNDQGLAILLVEQEVEASLSISTRGYVMHLGRVVLSGPGPELLADNEVRTIYLGKRG